MDEGKVTKSDDTTQPGAEVSSDLWSDFRATVGDVYGNVRGNVGTALEDALRLYIEEYGDTDHPGVGVSNADLLTELREIKTALSDDGLHTHTRHLAKQGNLDPQVRSTLEDIIANLPDGTIRPSDIKKACHDAGVTDKYRSIPKYRDLLEDFGVILPHPEKALLSGGGTDDPSVYVDGTTRFALICENTDSITSDHVDRWIGELERVGVLSVDDYRDALPPDFRDSRDLKIDEAGFDSSDDRAEGST